MYRRAILKIRLEPHSTRYRTNYPAGTGTGYMNTCCIANFLVFCVLWILKVLFFVFVVFSFVCLHTAQLFIKISFSALSGSSCAWCSVWLLAANSMGEPTAKKDPSLIIQPNGWDIRYLVQFWPEPNINYERFWTTWMCTDVGNYSKQERGRDGVIYKLWTLVAFLRAAIGGSYLCVRKKCFHSFLIVLYIFAKKFLVGNLRCNFSALRLKFLAYFW